MAEGRDRRAGARISRLEHFATVLVVDDEPSALRLLHTLFEERGWRVIDANNGREALVAYETNPDIDLVVSDIQMPEMDGLTLCQRLEGFGIGASVILVSSCGIDAGEINEVASTIAGFFAKPLDLAELMATALETIDA